MAIVLPQGLEITSKQAVDTRLLLSKEAMLQISDSVMPQKYFTICVDDGLIYLYNKANTVDPTTGRFRLSNKDLNEGLQEAINDISALNEEMLTKENNDIQKISNFFEIKPEFDYKFLLSIANKPVIESEEYLDLVVQEFVEHNPTAVIPFDIGKMGIIVKVGEALDEEYIRVYIPSTAQVVSISLIDPSGLIKFTFKVLGDEGESAKWGKISGNISDQTDLGNNYVGSESNITNTEIDSIFG